MRGFEQNAVGSITIPPQTWFKVSVDRPTILQPVYEQLLDATYGANFVSELFYSPKSQGLTVGATIQETLVSFNGGVCFLDSPGDWWVFNQNTVYAYELLQIDASSPAVARFYQSPIVGNFTGQSFAGSANNDDLTINPGSGFIIIGPNWYRTNLIIQNVTAAGSTNFFRVWSGTQDATATRGIRLTINGSLDTSSLGNPRERFTVFGESGTSKVTLMAQYI